MRWWCSRMSEPRSCNGRSWLRGTKAVARNKAVPSPRGFISGRRPTRPTHTPHASIGLFPRVSVTAALHRSSRNRRNRCARNREIGAPPLPASIRRWRWRASAHPRIETHPHVAHRRAAIRTDTAQVLLVERWQRGDVRVRHGSHRLRRSRAECGMVTRKSGSEARRARVDRCQQQRHRNEAIRHCAEPRVAPPTP